MTQKPKITQELKEAVETLLLAQVNLELIAPIVRGYQSKVLADMRPAYSDKYTNGKGRIGKLHQVDEVILDPKDAWEMGEADFTEYLDRLHTKHLEYGFNVPSDQCPLLIAENDVRDAQRLVLETAQYITDTEPLDFMVPTKERNGLENYQHAVDLIVGLVLSLCPEIRGKGLIEQVLKGTIHE